MQKDFVDHISELLNSAEMEVCYFSAGIIANLLSRGEQAWTLSQTQRRQLIEKLVNLSAIFFLNILSVYSKPDLSFYYSTQPSWSGQHQNARW